MVRVEGRGYRVAMGKPEEKRLCGRPVREWRVILKWIVMNYDLCVYVCIMYLHMYVCVYICIDVCTCVRMYVHGRMYVCNVCTM